MFMLVLPVGTGETMLVVVVNPLVANPAVVIIFVIVQVVPGQIGMMSGFMKG
jgi:hypothetical protein